MATVSSRAGAMLTVLCLSVASWVVVNGDSGSEQVYYNNSEQETKVDNDTQQLFWGQIAHDKKVSQLPIGRSVDSVVARDQKMCPHLWFVWDNGSCHCGNDLHGVIQCDPDTKEVEVLDCNCLTIEYMSHGVIPIAGACIFNCVNYTYTFERGGDKVYHSAPSDCASLNRQGTLCGQCLDGYTVPAYSYKLNCIRCDSQLENWGLYIVFAFVPLTVFIVIILILRINVLSPKLFTFVFASQIVTTPAAVKIIVYYTSQHKMFHSLLYRIPIALLSGIYGIWNLDFFRVYILPDVCINVIPLHIMMLDYLIALYPMLLMAVAYTVIELYGFGFKPLLYMWKPFHFFFARFRRQWDIQTTIMDAFVTFFFLSTTKLLSVSFGLLMGTAMYKPDGKLYSYNLYYDPSIKYFGKEHLPYALMALAILVFFIALPTSLLLFYQCRKCQKCLVKCHIRGTTLSQFLSTFQKYYKDGSNGTQDCRWFAAFFILVKLLAYVIYSLSPGDMFLVLATILFTIGGAVVVIVKPYKEEYSVYNIVSANLLLWQGLLFISFSYDSVAEILAKGRQDHFVSTIFISFIPLVYIAGVAVQYLLRKFRNTAYTLTNSLPHRLLYPNQY